MPTRTIVLLCHVPICCLRCLFTCPELTGDTKAVVYVSFNIKLLLHVFVFIFYLPTSFNFENFTSTERKKKYHCIFTLILQMEMICYICYVLESVVN
jgi:hypothetical protein